MANDRHELKNNAQRALVMQGGASLGAYEAGITRNYRNEGLLR